MFNLIFMFYGLDEVALGGLWERRRKGRGSGFGRIVVNVIRFFVVRIVFN